MTITTKLFLLISLSDAYSDIDARLVVKKYAEKGTSVTLYCEHNVDPKILDKVSSKRVVFIIHCIECHKFDITVKLGKYCVEKRGSSGNLVLSIV